VHDVLLEDKSQLAARTIVIAEGDDFNRVGIGASEAPRG